MFSQPCHHPHKGQNRQSRSDRIWASGQDASGCDLLIKGSPIGNEHLLANEIHETMISVPYRCRALYARYVGETCRGSSSVMRAPLVMARSSQISHTPPVAPSLVDRFLLFRLSPPPHANQSSQSHRRELHKSLSLDSGFLVTTWTPIRTLSLGF